MKKIIVFILIIFFVSVLCYSRAQVKANDIIKKINKGEAIFYNNVEIMGDVDFRSVKDITLKKSSLGHKEYIVHVRVPVSFVSCSFANDFLAYINDEEEKTVHNVVFYDNAIFTGCEFKGKSAFKYVKFLKKSDFKETKYRDEALFKYSEFNSYEDFSNSIFRKDANFKYTKFYKNTLFVEAQFKGEVNFKYTKFKGLVDFSGSVFNENSNFKYTEFKKGVKFKKVKFKGDVNFKYTRFSEPVEFKGAEFDEEINAKYAKVGGKSFTRYLLNLKKDK